MLDCKGKVEYLKLGWYSNPPFSSADLHSTPQGYFYNLINSALINCCQKINQTSLANKYPNLETMRNSEQNEHVLFPFSHKTAFFGVEPVLDDRKFIPVMQSRGCLILSNEEKFGGFDGFNQIVGYWRHVLLMLVASAFVGLFIWVIVRKFHLFFTKNFRSNDLFLSEGKMEKSSTFFK